MAMAVIGMIGGGLAENIMITPLSNWVLFRELGPVVYSSDVFEV